jgi:hypothetical protein
MAHTLGKPGCPKCKGVGVYPGPDRVVLAQSGREVRYPTVIRCSCLEKPSEEESSGAAGDEPDQKSKAAGETG